MMSVNAAYSLFIYHIYPKFAPRLLFREAELLAKFWCEDSGKTVRSKVEQYHQYEADLKCLFDKE